MKTLDVCYVNLDRCRREVKELRRWLAANPTLDEKEQILPFFRTHRHLAAFVGSYGRSLNRYDRIAFEFPALRGLRL